MKKLSLILFALAPILAASSIVRADEPGSCYAKDESNGASRAYCESFSETPCRMNSNLCDWYPEVTSAGSCQPNDESNTATAAYCESFDETPCLMNTQLCHWIR